MSQRTDDKNGEGLALPLRAVSTVSAEGFNFGWCVVDANNRVLGYCMTERQAAQLVAPFASSAIGAWVKVEDRLPEERIRVLAWDGLCVEDCFYGVGTDRSSPDWSRHQWRITSSEIIPLHPITHWMPLPDAPTDGKGD